MFFVGVKEVFALRVLLSLLFTGNVNLFLLNFLPSIRTFGFLSSPHQEEMHRVKDAIESRPKITVGRL